MNVQSREKLVQQDHIFALVPNADDEVPAASYLKAQNVPVFGLGGSQPYCQGGNFFSPIGCAFQTTPRYLALGSLAGVVDYMGKHGGFPEGKTSAVVWTNDPTGVSTATQQKYIYQALGFTHVSLQPTIPEAGVVSDWSPYVKSLTTSNNGGPPSIITMGAAPAPADPTRPGARTRRIQRDPRQWLSIRAKPSAANKGNFPDNRQRTPEAASYTPEMNTMIKNVQQYNRGKCPNRCFHNVGVQHSCRVCSGITENGQEPYSSASESSGF